MLEELDAEAVRLLPNLLESWHVTTLVTMGQRAEQFLLAKACFGKAAERRLHLLTLIQERLEIEDIQLSGRLKSLSRLFQRAESFSAIQHIWKMILGSEITLVA